MPIVSKSKMLIGWEVVVVKLDWTQRGVEPQQVSLDVYWGLKRSTAERIMPGPVVLSLWSCKKKKVTQR